MQALIAALSDSTRLLLVKQRDGGSMECCADAVTRDLSRGAANSVFHERVSQLCDVSRSPCSKDGEGATAKIAYSLCAKLLRCLVVVPGG